MTTPHERTRALVEVARADTVRADNAPSIVNAVLSLHWDELAGDLDVLRHIVARGLNSIVREILSRHRVGDDDVPCAQRQFSLWPPGQRELIERINRERIYVPSREDYVELVPDALTPSELNEAGIYLIGHGEDAIRRGQALRRLAQMRGFAGEEAA